MRDHIYVLFDEKLEDLAKLGIKFDNASELSISDLDKRLLQNFKAQEKLQKKQK